MPIFHIFMPLHIFVYIFQNFIQDALTSWIKCACQHLQPMVGIIVSE